MKLDKILVPVDYSAASRAALELALGIAESFRAAVHVVHVLELPLYSSLDMSVSISGFPAQSYVSYAQRRAAEEMSEFLAPERNRELTQAIVTGEPSSMVLKIAEDGGYDLIVMGTHGRTGLKHLLLGSTAEWIVRHAPCPVLTTREPTRPLAA
jgi:nucleotide-binding universal stress UspA family protein